MENLQIKRVTHLFVAAKQTANCNGGMSIYVTILFFVLLLLVGKVLLLIIRRTVVAVVVREYILSDVLALLSISSAELKILMLNKARQDDAKFSTSCSVLQSQLFDDLLYKNVCVL